MSRPRLTFLIPTLCEENWVAYAVQTARASLRAADVSGEVIVCDGGSDDDTVAQARRAGANRVVCARVGRSHQLNQGARHARGDILAMLHADSLLTPEAVGDMVDAVDAGALGGWFQIDILPELPTLCSTWGLDVMAFGINLRTRLFRTATGDQCIFCRRDIFEQLGGMPDVALMEGNLFARRLRDAGKVVVLDPQLRISGRRWEKNGLLRTMFMMYGIRAAHRAGVAPETLAKAWNTLK